VSELPPVVILGTGGHAKVVIELVRAAARYHIVGCTGPGNAASSPLGVEFLGSDAKLSDVRAAGTAHAMVAVGDNTLRRSLAAMAKSLGFELINAVSPAAIISPTAQLGGGIAIMAGAILNACVRVGDCAIVNTGSVIDHDCEIGANSHVGPGCTLAGNCRVGTGSFLGAGVTVIPGISIGDNATVGAGAAVIEDVPSAAVVAGVPARPLR